MAGHIPAGMELFASGDESQMEVIRQWIDESDVFLLILGGRYGSIEPTTGKSYIQLEYEYALGNSKPSFACIITENALDSRVQNYGRTYIETENPKELKLFRSLVLSRICKFWDDVKDIQLAINQKLAELARREDLVGWVRSDEQANAPVLANEIARLSKENAELRIQLGTPNVEATFNGLRFDEMYEMLQRSNALEWLYANRKILVSQRWTKAGEHEQIDFMDLCVLGLFRTENRQHFELTGAGGSFINVLSSRRSHSGFQ